MRFREENGVRSCLFWWKEFHLLRTYVIDIWVESFVAGSETVYVYDGSVQIFLRKNVLKVKLGRENCLMVNQGYCCRYHLPLFLLGRWLAYSELL